MSLTLSSRDLDLITTLTGRVRLLAVSQLKALWEVPECGQRSFGHRLNRLANAGLIELHIINAHVLNPTSPLFAWQPNGPEPDPIAIARKARRRWRFAATPTLVCTAGALAANLMGSTACGLPKLEHRDHDLLLAAAYLQLRLRRAAVAELWIGEHMLPKAGYRIKDPDAFLRDPSGKVLFVVESSGSYSPAQVESFHEHCVEHDLPYELW